jgi:hypothetical protein
MGEVAQARFSGSAAFRSLSPKNRRPWQAGLRYTCSILAGECALKVLFRPF